MLKVAEICVVQYANPATFKGKLDTGEKFTFKYQWGILTGKTTKKFFHQLIGTPYGNAMQIKELKRHTQQAMDWTDAKMIEFKDWSE